MKTIALFLIMAAAGVAAEVSSEDKLALRNAEAKAFHSSAVYHAADAAVAKAEKRAFELKVQADAAQAEMQKDTEAFTANVNAVTEKLRKQSGCKDCTIKNNLSFGPPEKPETTPPPAAK